LKAARVAQFPPDLNTWSEAQVSFAIATAKGFEAMRRQAKAKGAQLKASAPATAVVT
jgi:hypothetical protein